MKTATKLLLATILSSLTFGCAQSEVGRYDWEDFDWVTEEKPLHVDLQGDGTTDLDVTNIEVVHHAARDSEDGKALLCYQVNLETSEGPKNNWILGYLEGGVDENGQLDFLIFYSSGGDCADILAEGK